MGDVLMASRPLEIVVTEFELKSLVIPAPHTQGIIFGRLDEKHSFQPDIDLGPYGARSKGVSRRHAVLLRSQQGVMLMDLESSNGTYVNGTRVSSDDAVLLYDGDEIKLGYLTMIIRPASQ